MEPETSLTNFVKKNMLNVLIQELHQDLLTSWLENILKANVKILLSLLISPNLCVLSQNGIEISLV